MQGSPRNGDEPTLRKDSRGGCGAIPYGVDRGLPCTVQHRCCQNLTILQEGGKGHWIMDGQKIKSFAQIGSNLDRKMCILNVQAADHLCTEACHISFHQADELVNIGTFEQHYFESCLQRDTQPRIRCRTFDILIFNTAVKYTVT